MIYDSLGSPLTVDDIVVYNLSGDLAVGKITQIVEKDRKSHGFTYFAGFIKIQVLESSRYGNTHISTVRNPKSIVVLKHIEERHRCG